MSPSTSRLTLVLLVLILAGCGSSGAPPDATTAPPSQEDFSARADGLETLTGSTLNLVSDVVDVLDPVDDLLIGVAQVLPRGFRRGIVRLTGNNVQLVEGTAVFEASFLHAGRERRFVVIRPQPARAGLAPVLLMLHGSGGTAENHANITEVAELVAAEGVWAVMPDSVNGIWDDDPANSKDFDDVGFVGRVIDGMVTTFPVDRSRVYAAGLSNGSFMTSRLACELPDRIAAFAVVAGAISGGLASRCNPQRPRSLMLIDGTNDPFVPYNGGRIGMRSVPQAYAFWLEENGCDPAQTLESDLPDLSNDSTTVELQANTRCSSRGEVRLYTVRGGGHAWPGGWQYLPIPIIGRTSTDIDATREIWAFVRNRRV